MNNRINVMKPWIGDEEAEAIADVLASGWVAQGPRVAAFEQAFAAHQRTPHAVATSSCTTALHLALLVAGVGAGDDVVVPSLSFIATANAAMYLGARPVFADVDLCTGNVTAETIARVLTPATAAVVVVDQGGVPADLDPIKALCTTSGITVIEDAACAVGATYRHAPVGVGADVAAWSFHPRKLLTTGEGGMLTTTNAAWADRARRLREHAMSASAADRHDMLLAPREQFTEVGYNFRMTDLQGAVGLVQLGRLEEMINHRRALARTYQEGLADVPCLRTVADPAYGTTNFQSFWVELLPGFPLSREQLLEKLAAEDISARRGIMAAHREPAYAAWDCGRAELTNTNRLTDNTVILPLYHQFTDDDQQRVISCLRHAGGADRP